MSAFTLSIATESAAELRRVVDALEDVFVGPPVFGVPIIFEVEGEARMGELRVKSGESREITASVKFLDAHGNEATADETPTWDTSNVDVADVTVSDDGLSATVTITGTAGESIIGAQTVETHDGAGDPTTIRAVGTIIVEPGDASVGSVEFTLEAATEPTPEAAPADV